MKTILALSLIFAASSAFAGGGRRVVRHVSHGQRKVVVVKPAPAPAPQGQHKNCHGANCR